MILDLTDIEETGAMIEPGEYTLTVETAELKPTKAGDGEYVNVRFKTEGGKALFHMFNTKNKNETAQKIGLGQLKAMMRLSGKADPNKLAGVEELLGLRVNALVKIKNDEYGSKPVITSFKAPPKVTTNPF